MNPRRDQLLNAILKKQCVIEGLLNNGLNPTVPPVKDVEITCISNDNGLTSTTGVIVYDTSIVPPTETIFLNGIDVSSTYTKVPCAPTVVLYDYEKESICVDGNTYTKVFVFDKTGDGSPNLVSIFWLDETDTVVPTPDPLLINNSNCNTVETCLPSISEAYGNDLSTLLPSHNFSIQKPDCCVVKVTTNVGVFSVQKGVGFYNTSDFKCPISITEVEILSGSCTLDKVYIIGNKLN